MLRKFKLHVNKEQLPATRCKSKRYSTSSQHQEVARWPVPSVQCISARWGFCYTRATVGQLCPFLQTFSHRAGRNLIPPFPWIKSDNWIFTVPENTEWEMAPEGKVGTVHLILNKWAWRKGDVIWTTSLRGRWHLKGAADHTKRNDRPRAESHGHDIAHTNDFISPSAEHLSPKNCTLAPGQVMVQC